MALDGQNGKDDMNKLNPMEVDYIEQALAYINNAWTESIKAEKAKNPGYMFGIFFADIVEHDLRLKLGLPSLKEVRRKKKEKLEKEMEKMMEVEVETVDFNRKAEDEEE